MGYSDSQSDLLREIRLNADVQWTSGASPSKAVSLQPQYRVAGTKTHRHTPQHATKLNILHRTPSYLQQVWAHVALGAVGTVALCGVVRVEVGDQHLTAAVGGAALGAGLEQEGAGDELVEPCLGAVEHTAGAVGLLGLLLLLGLLDHCGGLHADICVLAGCCIVCCRRGLKMLL